MSAENSMLRNGIREIVEEVRSRNTDNVARERLWPDHLDTDDNLLRAVKVALQVSYNEGRDKGYDVCNASWLGDEQKEEG